jgi:hypothetical protein
MMRASFWSAPFDLAVFTGLWAVVLKHSLLLFVPGELDPQ